MAKAGLFRTGCISTHALREEGDSFLVIIIHILSNISTHALREEGDQVPHCL